MLKSVLDSRKRLHGPIGTAGEVYDENDAADAGQRTREHRVWGLPEACETHGLRDAWHFAVQNGSGCLGGHVARPEPRASGRKYDVHLASISPRGERFAQSPLVIGQHSP